MKFNKHYELVDRHAILSPSQYHWIRYSDEKVAETHINRLSVARASRLHDIAASMIAEGIKPQNTKATFNMYVNDAIGYKMEPEVGLKYSDNCFGHADAISFRRNKLRIHDLKNGKTPAKFDQLEIYAALFCLEYSISPNDIEIELRIYQFDDKVIHFPDPVDILNIMERIRISDEIITKIEIGE